MLGAGWSASNSHWKFHQFPLILGHPGILYQPPFSNRKIYCIPTASSSSPKMNIRKLSEQVWSFQHSIQYTARPQFLLLMQEIPNKPPGMYKTPVNHRINYQPPLVIAGFLNHQQYGLATIPRLHCIRCRLVAPRPHLSLRWTCGKSSQPLCWNIPSNQRHLKSWDVMGHGVFFTATFGFKTSDGSWLDPMIQNFQESQVQKLQVWWFQPIWRTLVKLDHLKIYISGENQQKSLQPPPSTTSWLFVKPRLADALPPGLGTNWRPF